MNAAVLASISESTAPPSAVMLLKLVRKVATSDSFCVALRSTACKSADNPAIALMLADTLATTSVEASK